MHRAVERAARGHGDQPPRNQAHVAQIAQLLDVVCLDAADACGLLFVPLTQRPVDDLRHDAVPGRDRLAVRAAPGEPGHLVHAVDQLIVYATLQPLYHVVHFFPPEAHHLDHVDFEDAMAADDHQGDGRAVWREADALIRFVFDVPVLGHAPDHARGSL